MQDSAIFEKIGCGCCRVQRLKNYLKYFYLYFLYISKAKIYFYSGKACKQHPFLYIFYMLSFSFQIYFQRQETQNKKENTKEVTNIQNKIEE